MTPIVNGLEREFAGKITVEQLDAALAANAELQRQYDLQGHPSFVVLDAEARVVQRFFGPQEETVLREALLAVANG